MYLKYFNVRTCFLISDVMWLTASKPILFHWPGNMGASWQQGWALWAMANSSMQTRTGHDKPWHRPCINSEQDNGTWNCWTGVPWYHHGLIRLVASANIWLEICSVVKTKGWDMGRCVPDTAPAEPRCCPSPTPKLAGANIVLLLAPLTCHGRNPKVKKQKAWWPSQPLSNSTGSKIVLPERR